NDAVKKQNKAGEISEDQQKVEEEKIQKATDKYVAEIDKMVDEKTKEIMTV
ncbi:MAG: ribosome recycling factor, partial [Eubacterium sp.]|nr:ribosome recycling factor [Eubacterium sp.]